MMIYRERSTPRLLCIVLMMAIMLIGTIIPASAAWAEPRYDVDKEGNLTKILLVPGCDIHNIVIPENLTDDNRNVVIKKISSNVFESTNLSVDSISIPATVTNIASNAFTNCKNLKEVTIDNYDGGITINANAFPNTAQITYTKEKPTEPQKPVQVAQAPQTRQPTAPTTTVAPTAPRTTKAAPSTTKATKTKSTTTTTSAPTTEPTTTVEITESTPFASAKEQLGDVNIWSQLVDQTTEPASNPAVVKNSALNTASYAAVVVVAFSAVVLGYLKFRK